MSIGIGLYQNKQLGGWLQEAAEISIVVTACAEFQFES